MSVPEGQRGEGKFDTLVKANALAIYTIKICNNKNVFLPEYQNALTNDIIRTAKNIFIYSWTENNILIQKSDPVDRIKEKWKERRRLQEKAALECNNLLAMMQMAQTLFHLKTKRIKYWGSKTIEVRNKIRSWIEADTKRYTEMCGG